jgi:hypothetical protein
VYGHRKVTVILPCRACLPYSQCGVHDVVHLPLAGGLHGPRQRGPAWLCCLLQGVQR